MCKMCTGCICVVLITGWSATCTKVSCAQVLKDAAKMGESVQPIIDEMKSKSKTGFHLGAACRRQLPLRLSIQYQCQSFFPQFHLQGFYMRSF